MANMPIYGKNFKHLHHQSQLTNDLEIFIEALGSRLFK